MTELEILRHHVDSHPGWTVNIVKNHEGFYYVLSSKPNERVLESWALTLEEAIRKAFSADPVEDLLS